MINLKEKLIDLVDSIDDENNKMGPPQLHRTSRGQLQEQYNPNGVRFGPPLARPEELQRNTLIQQFRGAPQPRGRPGFLEGGKHRKTKKRSKKGGKNGKVKKNNKTRK